MSANEVEEGVWSDAEPDPISRISPAALPAGGSVNQDRIDSNSGLSTHPAGGRVYQGWIDSSSSHNSSP